MENKYLACLIVNPEYLETEYYEIHIMKQEIVGETRDGFPIWGSVGESIDMIMTEIGDHDNMDNLQIACEGANVLSREGWGMREIEDPRASSQNVAGWQYTVDAWYANIENVHALV